MLMSSGWAPCQGLDRTGDRRREGHLGGTWGLWLGPPRQPQQCQGVQANAALTLAAMGFGFHPPGLEQPLTQWAKQTQTQAGQLAMQWMGAGSVPLWLWVWDPLPTNTPTAQIRVLLGFLV